VPPTCRSPSTHDEGQRTKRVLRQIRSALEQTRERIHDEIQLYPSPIPACDEHFNHLLAQRREISHALTRVPDVESSSSLVDCRRLVDDLLAADILDEEGEARLLSCLLDEGPRGDTQPRPARPREG
jgi:hypothetical protein